MSVATVQIITKKVAGRREVRYDSLDAFLSEAQRLATTDVQTIGNWSVGQIYEHLARTLDSSIDGDKLFPAPMRLMLNTFFKKKFLHKAIPAGFKSPAKFVPATTSVDDGFASLRRAVARQSQVSERALHPGFGKLSQAEWNQFHLRHAEMHMSFILEK